MNILIAIVGLGLMLLVLWDTFEAIVLPRRVTRRFRVTRMFYQVTWRVWSAAGRRMRSGKRREAYLSYYGPLSMLALLAIWAVGLVLAFALMYYGTRSPLGANGPEAFAEDLYFSGTTFFTLGLGDVKPESPAMRAVAVIESGMGFGFLALVIGYLPVIYQGFSRRELSITLLDARAGSPATAVELIRRYGRGAGVAALPRLLEEWERWAAELLESHISYPVLAYFRSQHDNQSWLAALTLILDASALILAGVVEAPEWPARLTFAMARHATVDLAQIFNTPPLAPKHDRLTPEELSRLRSILTAAGVPVSESAAAEEKLRRLRRLYEPYVNSLGDFLLLAVPPWNRASETRDNWQSSAWERISPEDEHS